MPNVISVENICKYYTIGHRKQYQSYGLRDHLQRKIENVKYKIRHPLSINSWQVEEEKYWALKDVSFDVKQGERIGIIGPNGAGKSTLLKILSRIVTPSSGRVELMGRVVSLLEVGTGFHPELSGRENIYLNGSILGMTRLEIKNRFDEIVSFAEVDKFIDTPVKRYSSGMRVRLAFSVAAHLDADIIFVDEVLAVGDAAFQKKCIGNMESMSEQGRTILFVSHNMGTVQSLCDRVILLDEGRLKLEGDSASIIRKYLDSTKWGEQQFSKGYKVNRGMLSKAKARELMITDCELINPVDTEIGPRTGDPLIIRIHYSAKRQWQSPAFVVSVKDSSGYELIRLSTMPISGYRLEKLFLYGCIELTLNELPFVAGAYYMDISFVQERLEHIVRLENVIEMEVGTHDIYGSGFLLDKSRGLVVTSHKWTHSESRKESNN